MRVPTESKGLQYLSHSHKEHTAHRTTNVSKVEAAGAVSFPKLLSSGEKILQETNLSILRLTEHVRTLNLAIDGNVSWGGENVVPVVSSDINSFMSPDLAKMEDADVVNTESSEASIDLEELAVALMESVNEVLRTVITSEVNDSKTTTDINSQADKQYMGELRAIIASAVKTLDDTNAVYRDLSSVGIKLTPKGLFEVDSKTFKEAVASSGNEVARVIKTVASNLLETLPLCIDPNSGALIYTGKRLEDSGDDKAARVLAAMSEDLEKYRTELEKRLGVAEALIAHSNRLIDSLTVPSEVFHGEE